MHVDLRNVIPPRYTKTRNKHSLHVFLSHWQTRDIVRRLKKAD